MTARNMAEQRPAAIGTPSPAPSAAQPSREERLKTLYARWDQFAAEYAAARQVNDQEVMTNLRGLMLLIMKEIRKLGGELPAFPYPDEPHLADL